MKIIPYWMDSNRRANNGVFLSIKIIIPIVCKQTSRNMMGSLSKFKSTSPLNGINQTGKRWGVFLNEKYHLHWMESNGQTHDREFFSIKIIPYWMESNRKAHDGEFILIQVIPYWMESNRQTHDGGFFSIQFILHLMESKKQAPNEVFLSNKIHHSNLMESNRQAQDKEFFSNKIIIHIK